MTVFEAILLAIIEGLTEFLPISSTGHMILASSALGIASDPFVKMFTVAIQLGAIFSVVVLYFKRFFQSIEFYLHLLIAFMPAAIIGFLLNDVIDQLLESALTVAVSLVAGGILLLYVDRWFKQNEEKPETLTRKKSLMIGLFQVISMIPGVSRSAATIVGGLTQKLNRKAAAEFSFFLAVPTMLAATAFKMYKYHQETGFDDNDLGILVLGNVVAFVVAWLAIKAFISYLTRYGFRVFGMYRIALGLIILLLYALGYNLQIL